MLVAAWRVEPDRLHRARVAQIHEVRLALQHEDIAQTSHVNAGIRGPDVMLEADTA